MRLAAVVTVAGVLMACTTTDRSVRSLTMPRIAVLGDSIAFQSAEAINDALAPIPVRNESAIGRRIEQAVSDAHAIVADGYETVTVILGTNDAHRGITENDLREIRWLAAVLRPVRCVRWVPIAAQTGDPELERAAAALNQAITEARGVELVPWSPDPAWFRTDGIHLNDAGQRALADAIRASLADC